MSDYTTVAGLVQFDPRNRLAGGKDVRDVLIRNIGDGKNYSITLWPEKSHIQIAKGDFIVCDGKRSSTVGQNKDGEQVTYNNLSATTIIRLAGDASASNAPDQSTTSPGDQRAGDNFPF